MNSGKVAVFLLIENSAIGWLLMSSTLTLCPTCKFSSELSTISMLNIVTSTQVLGGSFSAILLLDLILLLTSTGYGILE